MPERLKQQSELIQELAEALGACLSFIMLNHEEEFIDADGEECSYEDGGNLSSSWIGHSYGKWDSFSFQECEEVLLKAQTLCRETAHGK